MDAPNPPEPVTSPPPTHSISGAVPPSDSPIKAPALPISSDPSNCMENCYVFKSRLQEYAQKAGIQTPVYQTVKEGPSHEPVFQSTVIVNDVKYESLPGFFNRKVAEHSAAEVALTEIYKSGQMTENIPIVHESGLCKNLLQEYAQKMNYALPSYKCDNNKQGEQKSFICTVEIGEVQYIGAAARTKKEAEIKAARTALLAIQNGSESKTGSQYTVLPGKKKEKEPESRPQTTQELKPKKAKMKKKWSKRKFPRNKGAKNYKHVDNENELVPDGTNGDGPLSETKVTEPSAVMESNKCSGDNEQEAKPNAIREQDSGSQAAQGLRPQKATMKKKRRNRNFLRNKNRRKNEANPKKGDEPVNNENEANPKKGDEPVNNENGLGSGEMKADVGQNYHSEPSAVDTNVSSRDNEKGGGENFDDSLQGKLVLEAKPNEATGDISLGVAVCNFAAEGTLQPTM